MNTPPGSTASLSRRHFLTASVAATTLVGLQPATVFTAQPNTKIALGLIGCGGRGQWIADLFRKDGRYEFVAGADYFEDRVNMFGDQFRVPASRRYTGLMGYQRLLESPVDAVVIETPPHFHPEQALSAIEAGKHVFLAKPVAVDAPGCLTIAEAGRRATANRRVLLVDFQTRANSHYREALNLVRAGAIGPLVLVEAHYPWRGGGRGLPPTTPEEQLRSWYYVLELGGDFIVEQSIHALDVATWILDADPLSARGTGGRKVRPAGSIFDHFALHYAFPNDLTLAFTSIQTIPEVKDEIRARAYGADGVLDTDYYTGVLLKGTEAYRGEEPNLYTTGAQVNIAEFYQHITEGNYDNPTVAPSVRANLTAILGREAAYRRAELKLTDLLLENRKLQPNLKGLRS